MILILILMFSIIICIIVSIKWRIASRDLYNIHDTPIYTRFMIYWSIQDSWYSDLYNIHDIAYSHVIEVYHVIEGLSCHRVLPCWRYSLLSSYSVLPCWRYRLLPQIRNIGYCLTLVSDDYLTFASLSRPNQSLFLSAVQLHTRRLYRPLLLLVFKSQHRSFDVDRAACAHSVTFLPIRSFTHAHVHVCVWARLHD